ncbi:MAG TPA: hypothetical protein VGG24_20100 [Paraburkholderia sp.]
MRLPARIGMLGATLLALVGAGPQAQAGTVDAGAAPEAWVAYAQRVSQQFQVALAGDSEPAQRFSAWVDQFATAQMNAASAGADPQTGAVATQAGDPPTFRVRVWLDRAGKITRVEPDDIDDEGAVADLRALLMAQTIGARPPRGMKQPVVVRLAPGVEL